MTRPSPDPGNPGIFSWSKSRDFGKWNPGIFRDLCVECKGTFYGPWGPSATALEGQNILTVVRTHLNTHSGEKPNATIINSGDLRRHLKAHSGERSNKCNQCDFAFIQAGNLRPHVKAHSGEKPNKCNSCDFTPIKEYNLRNHLKISPQHIQERNLKHTF